MRFASLNSWVLATGRKAPAVPSLISWTDRTHTLLKRPVRGQAAEVPEPGIESQVARSTRSSCREHGSLGVLEPVRESNGSGARRTHQRAWLRKGAILQLPGPGRVIKGLGVAKRYCASESSGEGFVQRLPRLGPGAPLEAGQSRREARPLPLGAPCSVRRCSPGPS